MLLLFLGLQLALLTFFLPGYWLLKKVSFLDGNHLVDFVLSTVTGLFLCGLYLMVASLFLPVSCWVLAAYLIVFSFILVKRRDDFKELKEYKNLWVISSLVFAFLSLLGAVTVIEWGDSGLYHIQSVEWIRQHGTVKGLALVHGRFGFVSLWFYLIAPFVDILKVANSYMILNLFLTGLILTSFIVSLLKLPEIRKSFSLVAFSLILFFVLGRRGVLFFIFSPSPDFPLYFLTALTCWQFIRAQEISPEKAAVTFWLAVVCFCIKPIALPLCIGSLLVLAFSRFDTPVEFIKKYILLPGALLLPFFICRFINSGCVLYPSAFLAFDVSYGVGKDAVIEMSKGTTNWARGWDWYDREGTFITWLQQWWRGELKFFRFNYQGLWLYAGLVGGIVACFFRRINKGIFHVGVVCSAGILFVLVKAPAERFMYGYLLVPVSLLVALAVFKGLMSLSENKVPIAHKLFLGGTLGVFLAGLLVTSLGKRVGGALQLTFREPGKALLSTVELPQPEMREMVCNNFTYYKAIEENSWGHQLPSTPFILKNIELVDPEVGLSSGFIRVSEPKKNDASERAEP